MSSSAPLNSSSSPSPYQTTQILSDEGELLKSGYTPISIKSDSDRVLCQKLQGSIEMIKEFVWMHFKMVGVDDKGTIPPFFIHLKDKNAYYLNSSKQEYFNFNDDYVSCPEVICHEFTHGIIHHLNPLPYEGESGALDESMADVVGIVFKRSVLAKDDWKIANLRNLSDNFMVKNLKETKPRFDDNNKTTNDYGNVHFNSSLPSHAFYLVSSALEKYNTDPGNKQLLKIWFEAFKNLKKDKMNFVNFVNNTIDCAHKESFVLENYVKEAWMKVGFVLK